VKTSNKYDRHRQDVGNIVALEHVNVRVPEQRLATIFWIVGMGFTRDPYLMVGAENMWVNIGQQQFHLPTGEPQVLRGVTALVVPDLGELTERLDAVRGLLVGTRFAYEVEGKTVTVTCPWGNRLRCHAPSPEFGDMVLGMPYVEFPVAPGDAAGVARFYETFMGAPATVGDDGAGVAARVRVGGVQALVFRETTQPIAAYDGHHIAIYIADFSGPYRRLLERGLITRETSEYEWRVQSIVDPDDGRLLFEIEHEVRSLTNPLYLRPLVNRNPAQRQPTYQRGRDAFVPRMG
jgi:hypothetical protein